MRATRFLITILTLGFIVLNTACEEEPTKGKEVGAIVGAWDLTAFSADYLREVALPAGWTGADSFAVTARWDLAPLVLGADSTDADRHLFAFYEGNTVLDTTAFFDAAALQAVGIQMTADFEEDESYTLTGTYPTLRLDPDACRTALTIAPIQDAGTYHMDYTADQTGGTLTIAPNEALGDQVLPSFDDGVVAFVNDTTMTIDYVDRSAHDVRYAEIKDTWDETDDRVTMGVADLPVDATTGAFTEDNETLNDTAYVMDTELASWGYYFTFYTLIVNAEITYLFASQTVTTDLNIDGTIDEADAVTYIFLNRASGMTHLGLTTELPYFLLISEAGVLTDDSSDDFSVANAAAGGKLKYVINAVCVPVNEIIVFESTWEEAEHTH